MMIENILNNLKELVTEKDPNKKYNSNMKKILSKLTAKAQNLEIQLENESNEKNRKNINLTLKVIYKQLQKGEKLIYEREASSRLAKTHKHSIKPELSPRIMLRN